MERRNYFSWMMIIAAASAVFFIPFIGNMHLFDWDEINFAECAREMIVTGDFLNVQIDFKPFWEKPPLFIWLQVLSMKAFGINEFAARFPNAVCGIVTLLLIFKIGDRLHSKSMGLWWLLVYAASILPQLYFRSGIIDPWFNLFIFLSVWYFSLYSTSPEVRNSKIRNALLSGFFIGLAVMTKGPTAFLILGLVIAVYFIPVIWNYFRKREVPSSLFFSWKHLPIFLFTALFTGGFWFILQILNGHGDMVVKFIMYQVRLFTIPDAGHGGHWSYHFWVLLAGVFPASVIALKSFRLNKPDNPALVNFHKLMLILFWVVLILFSIVKTKIVHYSSLCYFPLTFLAAKTIVDLLEGKKKWNTWLNVLVLSLSFLIASVVIAIPLAMQFKAEIIASGIIKDSFAVANLGADVHWSGFESLIGLIILSGAVFFVLFRKRNFKYAMIGLLSSTLLFTWLTILVFPYKIEKYTQGAAIEFFKEKAGEDCYILNTGYFSYAPLFYGNKNPEDKKRPMWLLTENIDKPFYLVLKEPHYEEWKHIIPAMEVLYKKNGFVFLSRKDAPKVVSP
ncbi:MAG: glycosyltransferase family 39 protein [Bacteroidales bacterium]|nr:glycosyltransferase family 39 protein [Bacteroidales bacterium]